MSALDCIIVGGGLAGGLAAYRVATTRPDLSVLLVEAGTTPGGNHTWSFHAGDLSAEEHRWMSPFVDYRWPRYEVRFPGRHRVVDTGYASVSSTGFAKVLRSALGDRILCGTGVAALQPDSVTLGDGRVLPARAVVDARGFRPSPALDIRFQKFLGLEVTLDTPGPDLPIVMDATVPQQDGYRFVYTLPFAPGRILVEDTYYSDTGEPPGAALETGIRAYAERMGWQPSGILRREEGVLPIALGGDMAAYLAQGAGVAAIGLRAGLFHPTTGYSLPDAVRTADLVARQRDMATAPLAQMLAGHAMAQWRARWLFRQLNRLLFLGADGDERRHILAHFHRLPDATIARFYAARLTAGDKVRIFAGKPPMPVGKALGILMHRNFTRETT